MRLDETNFTDSLKGAKIGDWFVVVKDDQEAMYFLIETITPNEILLKRKDNQKFIFYPKTSIEGNNIKLLKSKTKQEINVGFTSIKIKDKKEGIKNEILPTGEIIVDAEIEEKIKEDCKNNRQDIWDQLAELKQYSEFTMYVGDYIYDKDGDGMIKDGTESIIKFEVDSFEANAYICSLISATGKYKKLFNSKPNNTDFIFYLNSKLFNTDTKFEKNVAVQIWYDKNGPIILKDVYRIETEEEAEEIKKKEEKKNDPEITHDDSDDGEVEPRSMSDLLKDKDLMKLMNYQSVWDKALGRKAKGIKPVSDLKGKSPLNTLFGFNKKTGQQITFIYSEGKTLKGTELNLIQGKTYTGMMKDAQTIQLSMRNSKEKIFIRIGDKALPDNKRTATITYRNPSGEVDKKNIINGQIQIIK